MNAIILLSDNSLYNSLCHASTDETIPIDIELFLLYLDKNYSYLLRKIDLYRDIQYENRTCHNYSYNL